MTGVWPIGMPLAAWYIWPARKPISQSAKRAEEALSKNLAVLAKS